MIQSNSVPSPLYFKQKIFFAHFDFKKDFGALIKELSLSGVVEIDEDDNNQLYATGLGKIASFYYLQHLTARHFARTIVPTLSIAELMQILTEAEEFAELPVRHNEDNENEHLAKQMPLEVDSRQYDSPAVKAHLLLQCHMHRGVLPSSDYLLDTKTVMDNAARVIQSMIDISAEMGHLTIVIRLVRLLQVWQGDIRAKFSKQKFRVRPRPSVKILYDMFHKHRRSQKIFSFHSGPLGG